jgi:hypothetical protein
MSNSLGTVYVDARISQYEGYLPDDWMGRALDASKPAAALGQIVANLLLAWRTAAYTASTPLTIIKTVQAAMLGYARVVSSDASIIAFSDGVVARMSQRIPDLVEDRRLRERLVRELVTLADEIRAQRAALTTEMPVEPVWQDFLKQDAFVLSVWSSQRVSFVAFYNAYEAFLVECVKRATGVTRLRAQDTEFLRFLRTAFGTDLSGPCWTNREIQIAREVRHSLSHAGGHETENLKKQKHGIRLEGSVLQIVPDDNHRLLRPLRNGVDAIITAAAAHPKFA